jgi:hypothetical protein
MCDRPCRPAGSSAVPPGAPAPPPPPEAADDQAVYDAAWEGKVPPAAGWRMPASARRSHGERPEVGARGQHHMGPIGSLPHGRCILTPTAEVQQLLVSPLFSNFVCGTRSIDMNLYEPSQGPSHLSARRSCSLRTGIPRSVTRSGLAQGWRGRSSSPSGGRSGAPGVPAGAGAGAGRWAGVPAGAEAWARVPGSSSRYDQHSLRHVRQDR